MVTKKTSRMLNRPSFAERSNRDETEFNGVKQVKESEHGGCVSTNYQILPPFLRSNPINGALFCHSMNSLKWSEGGRFHIYNQASSNISRTPWNRLRRSVRCMITEIINEEEYLWTGHATSEVCLWSQDDRLVGKPYAVGKTSITALCIIRPKFLWVGTDSGNIRGLSLDTSVKPYEIRQHTIVAPELTPGVRTLTSITLARPFRMSLRPAGGSIDNIPELEVPHFPERSKPSVVERVKMTAHKLQRQSRAHTSTVRCIFTKGNRIWSAGGKMFSSIKVWCTTDNRLEDYFMCLGRGPCTLLTSIPWHDNEPQGRTSGENWRLLSAHDSGVCLLWDPGLLPFRPLLEIEFRKSPIRSLVSFPSLGLMCTAHKDGSLLFSRLVSPKTQVHGFNSVTTSQTDYDDDRDMYPFVPRTISEDVFSCGMQTAVGGYESLFTISNRGAILHWTKERLESHVKVLRQSSHRVRKPVQAVNESVMVINRSQVEFGETVYDGDFARVKKGKFLAKDVIVKEAKDEADSRRAMDAIVKDAHILSHVRHPNIVNIMAVCDDPPFVVMQYYEEGSLYDVLRKCRSSEGRISKRFNWEKRLTVAIDVGCGMVFLHSQTPPVIHRDLKSPNIFIEKDFAGASVGDFNLSKIPGQQQQQQQQNVKVLNSARPSNPMWLPPEIAKGESDFTIASDLYSFGIILWEIMIAKTPWDHLRLNTNLSKENFFSKIRYELLMNGQRPRIERDSEGKLTGIDGGPFSQAEAYVRLMQDCWAEDPTDRPKSFNVVVSRLDQIRKALRESKSRSSLQKQMDPSKKGSSDTEGRDSSATVKLATAAEVPGMANRVDPVEEKSVGDNQTATKTVSLPPRSPSDMGDRTSTDIPRSPFDNISDVKQEIVDEQQKQDFNVYQQQQQYLPASALPISPFETPSSQAGLEEDQGEYPLAVKEQPVLRKTGT